MEKKDKNSLPEVNFRISHHEDAVLKKSRQFFAEELLLYFDIKEKIIAFAPTELVRLELQKCRKKITD